jgi:sirohydrochlorin cobaltochelatase
MTVSDVGTPHRASPTPAGEAVLLVAHGSARYPDAARPARAHVARILPLRPAALGLLNGTPTVAEALDSLDATVIRVVPFFMEDGYFTRVAVPAALDGDPRTVLCPAIGVHPSMADLVAGHARQGCARQGLAPATTALLLVGHGSARWPRRALALHRHAARIAAGREFALIRTACLEEAPLVADVLAAMRDRTVAVVGFFAGEGGHVIEDVPAALDAERDARGSGAPAVHNFGSVADNPAVTRIILEQASSI